MSEDGKSEYPPFESDPWTGNETSEQEPSSLLKSGKEKNLTLK